MDNEWKDIRITGIAKIEKCVGEFNVWELHKSPYGKFKVKLFASADGGYTGYSNLQVVDPLGSFDCAVGHGKTQQEALQNTIEDFLRLVSRKDEWGEQDFRCSDAFDF